MDEKAIIRIFLDVINVNIPNIIYALILIGIGFIVGKIFGRIVEEVLERSRIEVKILKKKAIGISSLFSLLASWLIYLVFIKTSIDVLNLGYLSKIIESVINFLGKFILFLVSFFVGFGFSVYIKNRIEESDIEFREIVSRSVFYFSMYIVLIMTLPILGIDTTILSWILIILLVSFLVPLSFSISWVLKDDIKLYLKKYMKKQRKKLNK